MNETIFRYLNNLAGQYEWLDVMIVFSADTLGLVLLAGLIVFLLSHKHKGKGLRNVVVILSAALLAWLISKLIKLGYPSPRPFALLDGVNKLIDYGGMDSFPSGHATFFSAIATALYFYHKKLALLYFLGALLIGLSRIVAGIHWPVDILAGYFMGGIVAAFAYYIYQAVVVCKIRTK